jgi:hypothetical protein|tara:strand:+ start:800 stop:1000 length:201 start_codon:yes stop_codon:yes gene_type:complete
MTDKTITTEWKFKILIELDLVAAATARQILFDAQKGYSYEYAPERITVVRDVVKILDEKIGEVDDE